MRYWVYINDKVDGPYEEDKLVTLEGFTPETLICSEEIEEGGSQEWVKASSIFEFDEAAKTMTRAPLTEAELDAAAGKTADVTATSPITAAPAADASATRILIEKIDNLTREIEDIKGKLDQALAASTAAQAAVTQHNFAAAQTAHTLSPAPQAADTVTEEALITNTESLVSHAEKLVAQASAGAEGKPIDFLDEIEIGAAKTEGLSADKGGEEVVLRSALDSLYGAKEQTEEEKEATFQDLLSSAKTVSAEPETADADAVKTEETALPAQQAAQETEAAAAETAGEKPQEQAFETAQIQEQEQAAPAQEPAPETLSEEKREEIINEITAPAQQNDLILQAIEEAQKQEEPAAGQLAPLESAEQTSPEAQTQKEQTESLHLQLPSAEDQPEAQSVDLPQDKNPLDLTGQPQLNIVNEQTQQTAQPLPQGQEEAVQPAPQQPDAASLTPMNPEDAQEEAKKEITETIKELVPGKKLEPAQEGIISQADLDEAFTERAPVQEFTVPAAAQPAPARQQAPESTGTLPEGKGFYNPNDMTEVELKEGSTYLISDFIPPAESKSDRQLLAEQMQHMKEKEQAAVMPGSPEAALAAAEEPAAAPQPTANTETVEEIVPAKKAEHNDITLSKVILENTIKTKRGATMDIKTVPMVQEPADTDRLDLTDSELDINTQHDLKAADFKQSGGGLTKIILGSLVSLVILALIYVMLAYLEILPAKFNLIKSGPSAEEVQARDQQLNEMLGTQTQTQSDMQNQAAYPQPNAYGAAQPMQMPAGVENQLAPQPMQVGAPQANPLEPMLGEVKNYPMVNGQTLQQLINSRHPAAQNLIEWNITTAVEPDNYSVLVKVPPENAQSFKISYRFNYNAVTKTLDPTISDSKNLLDSLRAPAGR